MTPAGWIMMGLCWSFVISFSAFLIARTLRQPRHDGEHPPPNT